VQFFVTEQIDKIRELVARRKKEKPAYLQILDLYWKIKEAQEAAKSSPDIVLAQPRRDLRAIETKEGFPLLSPDRFVIDLASSIHLFESICHIAKDANEKLRSNIQTLEELTAINALNLREVLKKHYSRSYLSARAKEFNIDGSVLMFLVHAGVQPSIDENVASLKGLVDSERWLRGYCPVCGSLPNVSELEGQGRRYLMCSFCAFLWPAERLKCPFCENSELETLHYIYEEGTEAYRVDLCDKCKQYIKTVDVRKLGYEPDLSIEDITSVHLDILASEEGFIRPVPSPWGI
jgi:FdhE protein